MFNKTGSNAVIFENQAGGTHREIPLVEGIRSEEEARSVGKEIPIPPGCDFRLAIRFKNTITYFPGT